MEIGSFFKHNYTVDDNEAIDAIKVSLVEIFSVYIMNVNSGLHFF